MQQAGNGFWGRNFRYRVDGISPAQDGNWSKPKNVRGEVAAGVPIRCRAHNGRKNRSLLTVAMRHQHSHEGGAWTYTTDVSANLQVYDSTHYADNTDFALPMRIAPVYNRTVAFAVNGAYVDGSTSTTVQGNWPGGTALAALECEITFVAVVGDVAIGDVIETRWLTASGAVFSEGWDHDAEFVIAEPGEADGAGFIGSYVDAEGHAGQYVGAAGNLGQYVDGDAHAGPTVGGAGSLDPYVDGAAALRKKERLQ